MIKLTPTFIAAAFVLFASTAQAASPFSHPAVARDGVADNAAVQAREASPALVGHPASPRWVIVHANHEHPAVQARLAVPAGIDANTFLVQPPASVSWTVAPGGDSSQLAKQ
jgi:hypothetical protein